MCCCWFRGSHESSILKLTRVICLWDKWLRIQLPYCNFGRILFGIVKVLAIVPISRGEASASDIDGRGPGGSSSSSIWYDVELWCRYSVLCAMLRQHPLPIWHWNLRSNRWCRHHTVYGVGKIVKSEGQCGSTTQVRDNIPLSLASSDALDCYWYNSLSSSSMINTFHLKIRSGRK